MSFIIYALPRSRTAWLSKFLTVDGWKCYHEQAIRMRHADDVRRFFSNPKVGTAETAAAQGRPLIKYWVPKIREVVILRPVNDVVESMMNVDVSGVATYDRAALRRNMVYGDRVLRKIALDRKVLVVDYDDLTRRDACEKIFEHCLEHRPLTTWWDSLKDENIQADARAVLSYYFNNRDRVEGFKKHCKTELRKLYRFGLIRKDDKCHQHQYQPPPQP